MRYKNEIKILISIWVIETVRVRFPHTSTIIIVYYNTVPIFTHTHTHTQNSIRGAMCLYFIVINMRVQYNNNCGIPMLRKRFVCHLYKYDGRSSVRGRLEK